MKVQIPDNGAMPQHSSHRASWSHTWGHVNHNLSPAYTGHHLSCPTTESAKQEVNVTLATDCGRNLLVS
eukprot:1153554-Pelagomonas_calceolata.AAC.4